MFKQLLPKRIDNTFVGQKLALWLFALLVLVKSLMSLNSIFNGEFVARTADGIPLDTYTPAGAYAVIAFLAMWGLWQLIFCLLGVLALVRYRAMIPLLFALLLLEHLSRKLIQYALPIVKVGAPPAFSINTALIALTVAGLLLSLWSRGQRITRAEA